MRSLPARWKAEPGISWFPVVLGVAATVTLVEVLTGCVGHPPGGTAAPEGSAASSSQGLGDIGKEGSIDRNELEKVMQGRRDDFNACYKSGFSGGNPYKAGEVATEFVIGPDGRANRARIKSSTLGMPVVEDCLLKTIRAVEFPVPQGGGSVRVDYPFRFGLAHRKEAR